MTTTARLAGHSAQHSTILGTVCLLAAESRPAVQAVFLLRFASTALSAPDPSPKIAFGMAGWLLVTVAVYVLNGISDVTGDQLNGSSRPLATGLVDLGTARIVAASCATCGVAIGLATCAGLGALSIALLVLGVGYSYGPCWKSGRRSAGVVIGAGAALTYCAGAVVGDVATWQLVAFTTALSVWVAMASASKDFSDIIGDRRSGRRTAPVELGSDEASRRLTSTTSLASVLVAGVTVTLGVRPIAAGCIVLGTVVLGLVHVSTRDPTSRVSTRAAYRVYMVTQYAACGGLLLGVAI